MWFDVPFHYHVMHCMQARYYATVIHDYGDDDDDDDHHHLLLLS